MDTRKIKQAISNGNMLAEKINKAKSSDDLANLSNEIEEYSNFVNQNFGAIDDFSPDGNEKYCDLTFYIHMAIEEKMDHLEYYNLNPNKTSDGVLDFLEYLNSKKWAEIKNAE